MNRGATSIGPWWFGLLLAGQLLGASPALAADWPQWRGPTRDGTVPKFKAPQIWPKELERGWQVEVGVGYSSPVVVGQHVFVFTRREEEEVISCLNVADGKEIWHQSYAAPYQVAPAAAAHGKGPKSTPAVAAGRVYTLGISGILSCWDADTGRRRWQKDFSKQYKHTSPLYGAASSPLIDGDKCIAYVGGHDQGALVALDAQTGELKWSWDGDGPGYSSPVIGVFSDVRQVITQSQAACIGIDAERGTLLWKISYATDYEQNIVTPVIYDESVILSGYKKGVGRYRIEKQGDDWRTNEVWVNKEVSLYMSSPVTSGERLFGFSHRQEGQLFALDITTGKTLWASDGRLAENAALVRTGNVVWALTTAGELIAFRDSEKPFDQIQIARYKVSDTATWASPVISSTRILIKDESRLTLWRFDNTSKVAQ